MVKINRYLFSPTYSPTLQKYKHPMQRATVLQNSNESKSIGYLYQLSPTPKDHARNTTRSTK